MSPRIHLTVMLAASLAFSLTLALATPPKNTENARIQQLLAQRGKVQRFRQVALSPNGQQLAWIVAHHGKSRLEISDWRGHDTRTVKLAGGCQPEDIAWRRHATTLAVLTLCKVDPSNTRPIKSSIQMINTHGTHPARVLVKLDGFAQGLRWSHSGKRLGFLFVPGATRLPFATASGNPRVGVIGVQHIQVQHVATVGLDGGKPTLLTPKGLYVYQFDWSPNDARIAYTAAPPPGDDNWWTAQVYVQGAQANAAPQVIVDPATVKGPLHGLQIQQPTWSPDGRYVYFVGGLMSDDGADAGDLYRVAAHGGQPVDLTEGTHVTLHQFTFLAPQSLLVLQESLGKVQVAKYTVSHSVAHQARLLFTPPGTLFRVSLSSHGPRRIAFAASSFKHAPEVYSGTLGSQAPSAVTALNAGLKPTWGKTRSVQWHDGQFLVQGWLMYPAHFDPHHSYPLIVYVHGSPTFANLPRWGTTAATYSAFGYFVLMPNPRGSTGEGEAYVQAIRGQMGYGDLDDILKGLDKVETIAPIDDNRVGMTGWSYGGFMSMFAPTQTDRFKAVVVGAGLSDWKSYYGENRISKWMIPFFGASVYDDPAAYAKSSAINFIKHDRTPALIVVGQRDEECPAPQSFEYWHALKTMGVPTTLVVYANQGHHIASHKDQVDIMRRSLDWFAKYLAVSK